MLSLHWLSRLVRLYNKIIRDLTICICTRYESVSFCIHHHHRSRDHLFQCLLPPRTDYYDDRLVTRLRLNSQQRNHYNMYINCPSPATKYLREFAGPNDPSIYDALFVIATASRDLRRKNHVYVLDTSHT